MNSHRSRLGEGVVGSETLEESFPPIDYPFPLRLGVRGGRWLAVSGQFGQIDFRLVSGGVEEQTRQSLRNVTAILKEHGFGARDVVKTTVYLAHIDDFDRMNRVYLEFFDLDRLPARTTAGVQLPFGAQIEIEAWARRPLIRLAERPLEESSG